MSNDRAHPAESSDASSRGRERAPSDDGGQRLACGAGVDDLLEQVAEGQAHRRSEHQNACAQCEAALTEFVALWAPVSTAVSAPVALPAGFTASVMSQVRRLAQDVWYTLELTEGGSIAIAARVVATLARDAARSVPGVRVALGRSTAAKAAQLVERATLGHRHPHAAVGVLGRTAVVDLALATRYGQPVQDVARAVQQRVTDELRKGIGLRNVTVNVTVDDILGPG
ncbi:Asp23/Gls24 family envelope stress response protein [uncultured Jatrophihabitans sp.]|uniref:Asp23/Gls24 family envelope stress response protein n=1 Tax=uncultured Jatrophihabitans sp. TaxID=1610747 RepID=UPI0035CA4451